MHGILGKSWELHVPHFQRLVNDLHNNANTDASNTAHMVMLPSKKIKARGRFNALGDEHEASE